MCWCYYTATEYNMPKQSFSIKVIWDSFLYDIIISLEFMTPRSESSKYFKIINWDRSFKSLHSNVRNSIQQSNLMTQSTGGDGWFIENLTIGCERPASSYINSSPMFLAPFGIIHSVGLQTFPSHKYHSVINISASFTGTQMSILWFKLINQLNYSHQNQYMETKNVHVTSQPTFICNIARHTLHRHRIQEWKKVFKYTYHNRWDRILSVNQSITDTVRDLRIFYYRLET
jgi:hypothetical protein